ncbi:MAG TPA: exodeoxyribonuclease VII small subunit [Xanthomonadales bacterium]|nr:exodeoxyribonuclease VII small subunit [Xanthomonadales bacterium]
MSKSPVQQPDFEKSLAELEGLVVKLESGELSLDQSLAYFKRGVELTRHCQSVLDEAQQAVELLTQSDSANKQSPVEDSI